MCNVSFRNVSETHILYTKCRSVSYIVLLNLIFKKKLRTSLKERLGGKAYMCMYVMQLGGKK